MTRTPLSLRKLYIFILCYYNFFLLLLLFFNYLHQRSTRYDDSIWWFSILWQKEKCVFALTSQSLNCHRLSVFTFINLLSLLFWFVFFMWGFFYETIYLSSSISLYISFLSSFLPAISQQKRKAKIRLALALKHLVSCPHSANSCKTRKQADPTVT